MLHATEKSIDFWIRDSYHCTLTDDAVDEIKELMGDDLCKRIIKELDNCNYLMYNYGKAKHHIRDTVWGCVSPGTEASIDRFLNMCDL